MASYTAGEIRPVLDRSLRRFRTLASLLNLGRRIFQKVFPMLSFGQYSVHLSIAIAAWL